MAASRNSKDSSLRNNSVFGKPAGTQAHPCSTNAPKGTVESAAQTLVDQIIHYDNLDNQPMVDALLKNTGWLALDEAKKILINKNHILSNQWIQILNKTKTIFSGFWCEEIANFAFHCANTDIVPDQTTAPHYGIFQCKDKLSTFIQIVNEIKQINSEVKKINNLHDKVSHYFNNPNYIAPNDSTAPIFNAVFSRINEAVSKIGLSLTQTPIFELIFLRVFGCSETFKHARFQAGSGEIGMLNDVNFFFDISEEAAQHVVATINQHFPEQTPARFVSADSVLADIRDVKFSEIAIDGEFLCSHSLMRPFAMELFTFLEQNPEEFKRLLIQSGVELDDLPMHQVKLKSIIAEASDILMQMPDDEVEQARTFRR